MTYHRIEKKRGQSTGQGAEWAQSEEEEESNPGDRKSLDSGPEAEIGVAGNALDTGGQTAHKLC